MIENAPVAANNDIVLRVFDMGTLTTEGSFTSEDNGGDSR
jgi:hypothetical protein